MTARCIKSMISILCISLSLTVSAFGNPDLAALTLSGARGFVATYKAERDLCGKATGKVRLSCNKKLKSMNAKYKQSKNIIGK